jgi:hypothetical protein
MAPPTMTMAAAMINALVMTMAIASFIGSPRAAQTGGPNAGTVRRYG